MQKYLLQLESKMCLNSADTFQSWYRLSNLWWQNDDHYSILVYKMIWIPLMTYHRHNDQHIYVKDFERLVETVSGNSYFLELYDGVNESSFVIYRMYHNCFVFWFFLCYSFDDVSMNQPVIYIFFVRFEVCGRKDQCQQYSLIQSVRVVPQLPPFHRLSLNSFVTIEAYKV